jgi:uncharacterized membrane protein YkoI
MMSKASLIPLVLGVTGVVALSCAAPDAEAGKRTARIEYALAQAKIGLAEAIGKIEAQLSGTVLQAKLEREHGRFIYEIELAKDGGIIEVELDPENGETLSSHRKDLKADDQRLLAAVRGAQVNLIEAIKIALQHTQGKAKSAELEEERGSVIYEIKVVRAGKQYKSGIDLAHGKVLWTDVDDD